MSYWLFQANPDRYRIHDSVRAEREEEWNLNQHAKDVRAGDRVVIWLCGAQAGVYAIGTILTDPKLKQDSPEGIGYWVDPREGRRVKARVRVRYDMVFSQNPLRKEYILCDPALRDLLVLRQPRRTNYAVTRQEWNALRDWLDEA